MVFHGTYTNAALSARSLPEKVCWHIIPTGEESHKLQQANQWPVIDEIANIKKGAPGAQRNGMKTGCA
jgi:hypothetical protein